MAVYSSQRLSGDAVYSSQEYEGASSTFSFSVTSEDVSFSGSAGVGTFFVFNVTSESGDWTGGFIGNANRVRVFGNKASYTPKTNRFSSYGV